MVCQKLVLFSLLGFNDSATARVISRRSNDDDISFLVTPQKMYQVNIKMAYTSDNNTVQTISKMGQHSSYSIMGANYKFLCNMYDIIFFHIKSCISKSYSCVCKL